MKKIISAVLILLVVFASGAALTFSALNNFFEYTPPTQPGNGDGGGGGGGGPTDNSPTLVVPAYKDYGRNTVDFKDIVYQRPNIDAAVESFGELCLLVEKNEVSFDEQLAAIKAADDVYFEISAMFSYANVMTSRDNTSEKWSEEYEYISVNYPKFSQAIENLFVSCARSVHAESFEEEYFGDGLIEKYSGGGSYTDRVVALMAAEAELEAEYSKIGMSTVLITINGTENTADYFLSYYYDKYGKNSYTETTYMHYVSLISSLYYDAYAAQTKPIYINLLKTRRLIADELSLDSYADFAYESLGHDYSSADMMRLLEEISEYIMPLYYKLYVEVFLSYATPDGVRNIHHNDILNTLYGLYGEMDAELAEAFSYMLQHGLYDISASTSTRYDGAFTVYIDTYNAPFIFVSTSGGITDYFTIAHEFGHFFDSYVNWGASSSLDLAEISSQALELLTTAKLDGKLSSEIADYLLIMQLSELFSTLRTQGLYSMFEHKAYSLSYDEITEERLNQILLQCEEKFLYPEGTLTVDQIVTIPHVVLYPQYVQSYCTSALVALEIYFTESETQGAGLAAYKDLISKGETSSFTQDLTAAGLATPFDSSFIKNTVNKIHRMIYGTDYFKTNDDANAA